MNATRRTIAEVAQRLYSGSISYDDFRAMIPEDAEADAEIRSLIDLIEHEPKIGGSVTPEDHRLYVAAIHEKIRSLK